MVKGELVETEGYLFVVKALPCPCFPLLQQSLSRSNYRLGSRWRPDNAKRERVHVKIFVSRYETWAGRSSSLMTQPSPKDLVTRVPSPSPGIWRKFDTCMPPAKRAPSDKGNIKLFSSLRGALHEFFCSGESKVLSKERWKKDKSPNISSLAKTSLKGSPPTQALSWAFYLPMSESLTGSLELENKEEFLALRDTSRPWPLNCDVGAVLHSCDAFYSLLLFTKLLPLNEDIPETKEIISSKKWWRTSCCFVVIRRGLLIQCKFLTDGQFRMLRRRRAVQYERVQYVGSSHYLTSLNAV